MAVFWATGLDCWCCCFFGSGFGRQFWVFLSGGMVFLDWLVGVVCVVGFGYG